MKTTPKRLKYVADYIARGDAPTYVDESDVLAINQACVSPRGVAIAKAKFHDPDDTARIGSWLQPGDVLVNSTGTGTLGRVGFVSEGLPERCFADGHVTIIRDERGRFVPRFLFYVLSIQQEQLTVECAEGATNQIELSRHRLGNKIIEWPAIEAQQEIADRLDAEISDLNRLIDAKQGLLNHLAEKRRALIAHAVTRGLNPAAPLRDSGIEWLGAIPAHWQAERARWLFGESCLPIESNDQMVTCFRDGTVTLRSNRREDGFTNGVIEHGYQGIRKGQLVLHSMDAFAGAIGVSDSDGKCTPEYVICDPLTSRTDAHYFAALLREMALRHYVQAFCSAVRERAPRIRFNDFRDFVLPVPPLSEQQAIVEYIDRQTKPLMRLADQATHSLELLKERRTALIAAAIQFPEETARAT